MTIKSIGKKGQRYNTRGDNKMENSLIRKFKQVLVADGYENVKDFISMEQNRVLTFDYEGDTFLVSIDLL